MNRSSSNNLNSALAFRKMRRHRGRIVIIAPHPDDETLGTGRLIIAARKRGIIPAFIMLTNGEASHPESAKWPPHKLAKLRKQELRHALGRLGLRQPQIRYLGWRDGRLADDGNVRALSALLHSLKAGTVLVTSAADHHPDHQAAYRLADAAVDRRSMMLWSYAVWSRYATPRVPAIEKCRAQQNWAMRAHRSQTSNYISDDPEGFSFSPVLLEDLMSKPEQYTVENVKRGFSRY